MISVIFFADYFLKTTDECNISEYNLVTYDELTDTYSPYTDTKIVINVLTGAIDIDTSLPFHQPVFLNAINSLGT